MDLLPFANKNRDISITHAVSMGILPVEITSVHGWIRIILEECWQWKPESRPTITWCKGIVMDQVAKPLTISGTDTLFRGPDAAHGTMTTSPATLSHTITPPEPRLQHRTISSVTSTTTVRPRRPGVISRSSKTAPHLVREKSPAVAAGDDDNDLDDLDGKSILCCYLESTSNGVCLKMSSRSSQNPSP